LPGIFSVVLFCAGAIGAQPPVKAKAASPATHYEITGVVINSITGDPVPRCHLTPTLNGRAGFEGRAGMLNRGNFGNRQFPAQATEFDCDARGHFTVSVPSAGAWHLVASALGFVSAAYDEHAGYSSAVVLTAEAPTVNLEFRLSPEASIVGQVLDEAGEPVRNAQIMLQNVPPPTAGGPQPVGGTRSAARTDDRGMYEMANLAPGSYRLSLHGYEFNGPFARHGLSDYVVSGSRRSVACGDDRAACGRHAPSRFSSGSYAIDSHAHSGSTASE
jgi:hypothetical protein